MKSFKKTVLLSFVLIFSINVSAAVFYLVGYPAESPNIESLRSALFYPGNESFSFAQKQFFMKNNFYDLGLVYSVNIHKGHPDLKYKIWIQARPAPIIVILPGIGSFYDNAKVIALAELFYLKGYSVLTISDVFNWEFCESASSVLTPGYSPVDSADIYYALCKIFKQLEKKYRDRITDKILVGFSLGALHTLFIADIESKLKNSISFSRYLALNPPVNLLYAAKKLDEYYSVGYSMTNKQITESISEGLSLYQKVLDKQLDPSTPIDLEDNEAKYIIGLNFHTSLIELIYSINSHNKLPVIRQKSSWFSREALYKEIDKFDFCDYLLLILRPYYSKEIGKRLSLENINKASSLPAINETLRTNKKIRMIHTANDFLLTNIQKKWLEHIMGERLTILDHGGHCGYLYFDQASDIICKNIKL